MDESGISGDNQVSVIQIAPTEFSRAICSISSTFFESGCSWHQQTRSFNLAIFLFHLALEINAIMR